jgi:hypothetical protein
MVKAIVRAHRWRDMLESGRYATCRELPKAEKINEAYLGRVLRLTLLSPAITEAILSGRQRWLFHFWSRKRRIVASESPACAFNCAAVWSSGQSVLCACAERQ